AAGLALGAVAVGVGGAGWWLLWGAGSLGLVAAIYAGIGERAFQKRADGSLPAATWWLLGPYLAGAWLNARLWARRLPAADAVAPGVTVGRLPSPGDPPPDVLVDVCAELPCRPHGARHVHVPMLDLVAPSVEQIERASAAVEAGRASGEVRVCCALGLSRSALAAAAWLVGAGRVASPEEAVAVVRRARPAVVLEPAHLAALQSWWATHRGAPAGAPTP
nr:serine/threonine protein phosphatase [Gammaproteobacteria bacterium]